MKSDFTSLKQQIASLHSAISKKIDERQALTAEIAAVNAAPPDKTAAVALLHQFIDEQAAKYPASVKKMISGYLADWQKGAYLKEQGFPLLQIARKTPESALSYSTNPEGLLYLLQEPIKEALERVIAALDWPRDSLDTPTRLTRLETMQTRLQAIDCELTALYDQCAGVGLSLPDSTLSPEEKETRRRAALAAQRKPNKVEILTVDLPGDKDFVRPKSRRDQSTEYSAADRPNIAFRENYENESTDFRLASAAERPDACEAADDLSEVGFTPSRDSLPLLRPAAL